MFLAKSPADGLHAEGRLDGRPTTAAGRPLPPGPADPRQPGPHGRSLVASTTVGAAKARSC